MSTAASTASAACRMSVGGTPTPPACPPAFGTATTVPATGQAGKTSPPRSAEYDELYAHDGLNRLTDSRRGRLNPARDGLSTVRRRQDWALDATGNWQTFREDADGNGNGTPELDQSRAANAANELTGISQTAGPAWATPAYAATGNMTSVPQPADPTTAYTAVYDAWNRLVRLEDAAGTAQENAYDARGFRTVRKSYTAGVLAETRHFYYDSSWRCLEERINGATTADRQYVWGLRYIDELICRDRDTDGNGTLDERLYALQDANWNVVALTDAAGTVRERYAYDAYGTPSVLDANFTPRAFMLGRRCTRAIGTSRAGCIM